MKKKKGDREKAAPLQEKDLAWVKGSSGYSVSAGRSDDDPDGGQ